MSSFNLRDLQRGISSSGFNRSIGNDCDVLVSIKQDFTCPVTYELVKEPIVSPCCGRIFEREATNDARLHQKPDAGGSHCIMTCPLCRELSPWTKWQSVGAVVTIANLLRSKK